MAEYLITGGQPLHGNVKIFGAKNSSFKIMLAALLSDEPSTISNICFVRDVIAVKQIIESLGGRAEVGANKTIKVSGQGLNKTEVSAEFGEKSRASTMILPVLLHRFGKGKVPLPGGDKIGERPLDRHVQGLEALGAVIKQNGDFIEAESPNGLVGGEYTFKKNTHTGTDTLLLAAVLARGTTVLNNAAEEPEVDDLIDFLNKMGASIRRSGFRQITITGVDKLHGSDFELMPDRNEAVTFACAALATAGDVFVEGAREEDLKAFLAKVDAAGGGYEAGDGGIRFYSKGALQATNVVTGIHPGFMTDWQAMWVTLMTQGTGESIVHEKVFENRFAFVSYLKQMGAAIELFNPPVEKPEEFYEFNYDGAKDGVHAAKVIGPTKLKSANLEVSDIRAGATLTLASLVAEGQSILSNIELIERGYENLEGRLQNLGAKIVKRN